MENIEVSGLSIEIVHKNIKSLRLAVYPPAGRIRVAAPFGIDNEVVRLFVISRLDGIKKQRKRFLEQDRQSDREIVDGESVYYQGRRYRLQVVEKTGNPTVKVRHRHIDIQVPPGSDTDYRNRVLTNWYRRQLRQQIPQLLEKWEPRVGIKVEQWKIKQMKTKWGTCNAKVGRVWLNLELVKKPPQCLEYVLVHEMVHFFERHHNDRFFAMMDQFLPQWRFIRDELNRFIMKDEKWEY